MTTYSNTFESTPLTAANLQRVVAEMRAISEQPIAVQPDTLVMSPALYGEWLRLCLLDAERELKHALKIISRAILSGHYERRQRQRVAKVAAYRLQRRRDMVAQLPRIQGAVDAARAELLAWQEHQARPRTNLNYNDIFFTT